MMAHSSPISSLVGLPPAHRTASRTRGQFGAVVLEDLDALSERVAKTLEHCDVLSRSIPALSSLDVQRDVLHLRARIESVSRQIDDAILNLDRIQRRPEIDGRQLSLPIL